MNLCFTKGFVLVFFFLHFYIISFSIFVTNISLIILFILYHFLYSKFIILIIFLVHDSLWILSFLYIYHRYSFQTKKWPCHICSQTTSCPNTFFSFSPICLPCTSAFLAASCFFPLLMRLCFWCSRSLVRVRILLVYLCLLPYGLGCSSVRRSCYSWLLLPSPHCEDILRCP